MRRAGAGGSKSPPKKTGLDGKRESVGGLGEAGAPPPGELGAGEAIELEGAASSSGGGGGGGDGDSDGKESAMGVDSEVEGGRVGAGLSSPPLRASSPSAAASPAATSVAVTAAAAAAVAAAAPSAASLGPGAVARGEGWSDRELLLGLVQAEDTPVLTAHDVSRSVGGIVVKRGLLLVCRNTVYFVDGFGREPVLPRPDAAPLPPAAAAAAAAVAAAASAAARRSKDPLYGVRRLEEWELGGGAGGIGGGDDDGEVGGAKIQVTLRRSSQVDVMGNSAAGGAKIDGCSVAGGAAGGGGGGGGAQTSGSALTAEQTGGTGGGAREEIEDEILALGHSGVQRFSLDQVWEEGEEEEG